MPKKNSRIKANAAKNLVLAERPGKGSHTNWTHPNYVGRVTIAGQARMRQSVARRDLPPSEAAMEVMLKDI